MQTLTVALGERSYPIYIGSGLLARSAELLGQLPAPRVIVVTNSTVAQHHLETLLKALTAEALRHDVLLVPDGEQHKDWSTLYDVLTRLLELGVDRSTTLVALGGGVIGDLAGFAAATYQRGIRLVQIPTTLLAQVDSSIGGKTAVNHPLGKNLIGAFHQPSVVIIDTETVRTLPEREYVAGIAEVIKCGAIRDIRFFEWLEANMQSLLLREPGAVAHAVFSSCKIKASIVSADERESGERALLNFGHTFAHAIETGTGYGTWLHGEAVAAGMVLAAALSQRVTRLPASDGERIVRLLERARLPVRPPALPVDRWIELMSRDKKKTAGALRFVLLDALGHASLHVGIDERLLRGILAA